MTKPAVARAPRADVPKVTPPKTIELACLAIGLAILGMGGRALGLLGSSGTLGNYLSNLNAKAKNPVKNYNVADAVHSYRISTLIQSAVVALALLMLVFALRRTRSASGSRWALLIIVVLTSLPFYVVPISGWPLIPQVASVITGVAALAAIVLIFVPASSAYFRQCRDAVTPPELRGKPRPGLAGLFAPRPPREPRARFGAPRGAAQPARPAPNPVGGTSAPGGGKSRSKVRADADAVAKGAELARSRAKSSKSRRTDA